MNTSIHCMPKFMLMMDLLVYIHDIYCNDIMRVVLKRINGSNYDDLSNILRSLRYLQCSIENLHIDDDGSVEDVLEDTYVLNDLICDSPELASIFPQLICPIQCKHGYEVSHLCECR